MRLRSRPILFARVLAEVATTRPFMRALLEQRRAGEPVPGPIAVEPVDAAEPAEPRPFPRAA